VVAPGGTLVVVRQPLVGKDDGEDGAGKRIVLPYGLVHAPLHTAFGERMHAALEGLLESGDLKVCILLLFHGNGRLTKRCIGEQCRDAAGRTRKHLGQPYSLLYQLC
jgi:hypothetical protein